MKLTADEQAVRDSVPPGEEIAMRTKTIRETVSRRNRHQRILAKLDRLILREMDLIRDVLGDGPR